MGRIYLLAEELAQRYNTRDPYELLDCIGAVVRFSHQFGPNGMKGFATIKRRVKYAVINAHLDENEQRTVAGHEAAHLIIHPAEILGSPGMAMQDFDLYNEANRLEHQANHFLANFLVSDEQVLDVAYGREMGFFHTASELHLPPELLAFKLYSMVERGLPVKQPVGLKSGFLRY